MVETKYLRSAMTYPVASKQLHSKGKALANIKRLIKSSNKLFLNCDKLKTYFQTKLFIKFDFLEFDLFLLSKI